MAYNNTPCDAQKKTRSGRIVKSKKCPCCMTKLAKPRSKPPARKRKDVKKDERPKYPTLYELETLAKKSMRETQQRKRKLEEPSTSGQETQNKKLHVAEEAEVEIVPVTLRYVTQEENVNDVTDTNDENNLELSSGTDPQEIQESNDTPGLVKVVLDSSEFEICTNLNEDQSDNSENKTQAQNESDKKMTEDPETAQNSAQNLPEQSNTQPKNIITLEQLQSCFPRRPLAQDFVAVFDKEPAGNSGEIENQSEQNIPERSIKENLLGFLYKGQARNSKEKAEDELEDKNEKKPMQESKAQQSNLEPLREIEEQKDNGQTNADIAQVINLVESLNENIKNVSSAKTLEKQQDILQNQNKNENLPEEGNDQFLLKISQQQGNEVDNEIPLPELHLEGTNGVVPFPELHLEDSSNEVLLPELDSDETNNELSLRELNEEIPTEVDNNDEINKLIEELTGYLTIQEPESQLNELILERVPEQNNGQDNNTSEHDYQGGSGSQSIEQNQNQNYNQGGSNSQSNEYKQNKNISESVENEGEISPDELKTEDNIDHFNINPSSSNSIVSLIWSKNKICCKHIQRIKILYIKDQSESLIKKEVQLKLGSLKTEVKEEVDIKTEPQPGFSGVRVEENESNKDVQVESNELEMKYEENENGTEKVNEETDHVFDPNECASGHRFLHAKKIPSLKFTTLQNEHCNLIVEVGETGRTDDSERQRLFQENVRAGAVEIYSENNVTADDNEEHFCTCGEMIQRTRYIFISDEEDMSLSIEEILEKYWYWDDD